MCVVSMIGDHYNDKWKDWKQVEPSTTAVNPLFFPTYATKEDIESLRKEVLEMKELLKKAIQYDIINNQKNCQNTDKLAFLKKVADLVGVDLNDILKDVK